MSFQHSPRHVDQDGAVHRTAYYDVDSSNRWAAIAAAVDDLRKRAPADLSLASVQVEFQPHLRVTAEYYGKVRGP